MATTAATPAATLGSGTTTTPGLVEESARTGVAARDPHRFGSAARIALALSLVLLCYTLFVCAWQCDDAYITFRTVKNVWAGHGLTWNPGERVQTFTSPLWLFLCLIPYGITGECYFSVSVLSFIMTLLTALAVVALTRHRPWLAVACVLALSASKAFVDYSVSGLENPLLTLLLALVVLATKLQSGQRRQLILTTLTSLVFLTRSDALLLVGPLWLWCVGRERPPLRVLAIGFLPAVAWEAFSLVYYGSLVPNTAITKLNLELPLGLLLKHGLFYFIESLSRDPITLLTIAVAVLLASVRGDARARTVAIGIVIYLTFVVRIGGDFMSGRFFDAPFVLALIALGLAPPALRARQRQLERILIGLAAVAFVLSPTSPPFSYQTYRSEQVVPALSLATGIAVERAYYFPSTGLLTVLAKHDQLVKDQQPIPPYRMAVQGREFARAPEPASIIGQAGFYGYFAGDKKVIDNWSLTDPFRARIPYRMRYNFRIGHYDRPFPEGYLNSFASGTNQLVDPGLREAFDAVRLVTEGPLFSRQRFHAMIGLLTGRYRQAFAGAAEELLVRPQPKQDNTPAAP